MTWIELSIKEWRRRPLRTTITAAGVAIATAACFSLLTFSRGYQAGVQHELDRLGAHVLLVPKGCPYDAASMALHGASWPCYLKQRYLEEVRAVPGVATAVPLFMAAVGEPDGNQVVYLGIQSNILALRKNWRIQGSFPGNQGELLIGSEVARVHGWTLNEQVPLPGLKSQTGTVVGILGPTQGAEDTFIHLPLEDAQKGFNHSNELTHILIRLADPNDLERAVGQLRGCDAGLSMNVIPLAHLFRTIQSMVNSTRVLLGCVAAVALLIAGAGVSNTVLMAVAERSSEIGILRAIGASRTQIFRLFWLETLQTCLGGAVVGIMLAFAASKSVEAWAKRGLPFSPTDALIQFQWGTSLNCLIIALALGSLAALIPAWRAASQPPRIAMQNAGVHG